MKQNLLIALMFFFCVTAHTQATDIDSAFVNVNSPFDEQNPILNHDGSKLYFTRGNHPENTGGMKDKGDIWFANLELSGRWSTPQKVSVFNDKSWNGLIGFSSDGKQAYLHNRYNKDGETNGQGISVSRWRNGKWSKPESLDIPYFKNLSKHQSGSISKDGKVILISMESYGSAGAEDIYVCLKQASGKWTEPKSLGRVVNTKYQELTPYLAEDNQTLYFSSNGHGGFGSSDVFVVKRLDDTWQNWTRPMNIGNEINTKGRELYCSFDFKKELARYVTVQNSDGYGDLKLKSFKPDAIISPEKEALTAQIDDESVVPEPEIEENTIDTTVEEMPNVFSLAGVVKDAHTGQFIQATISILSPQGVRKEVMSTDDNGAYLSQLPKVGGEYDIKVTAEGYISVHDKLDIPGAESMDRVKGFMLQPIKVGETVNLSNVLFERGTSNLLVSSYEDLDFIVGFLNENPNIEIELGGHTDNRGNSKINFELSKKRVDAVKAYLVEKGVPSKRIKGKGYGGTKPIANNNNEATRKLNRRVEFTIIKN